MSFSPTMHREPAIAESANNDCVQPPRIAKLVMQTTSRHRQNLRNNRPQQLESEKIPPEPGVESQGRAQP